MAKVANALSDLATSFCGAPPLPGCRTQSRLDREVRVLRAHFNFGQLFDLQPLFGLWNWRRSCMRAAPHFLFTQSESPVQRTTIAMTSHCPGNGTALG